MSKDNNEPEKCYAIVFKDGKYLIDWGYYGNTKSILLFTKGKAHHHIETFYPKSGAKVKKMRV